MVPPMNSLTVRPAEIFAINIPDFNNSWTGKNCSGYDRDGLSANQKTATTAGIRSPYMLISWFHLNQNNQQTNKRAPSDPPAPVENCPPVHPSGWPVTALHPLRKNLTYDARNKNSEKWKQKFPLPPHSHLCPLWRDEQKNYGGLLSLLCVLTILSLIGSSEAVFRSFKPHMAKKLSLLLKTLKNNLKR